jgi:hypothetical protein
VVLSLFGSPLSGSAAAALAAGLEADGHADAIAAAARIRTILASEFAAITLTDAQRAAVVRVLSNLNEATDYSELLALRPTLP